MGAHTAGASWRAVNWAAAACRDSDPELFFPIGEGMAGRRQAARAKAVCTACRVRTECLDWAMSSGVGDGVWGGYTERERRNLRRAANAYRL